MRFEDSKLPVFDSKPNRYQERGESFYNSMIVPLVEELKAGIRGKLKQCQIPAWMVDDGALNQQDQQEVFTRAV